MVETIQSVVSPRTTASIADRADVGAARTAQILPAGATQSSDFASVLARAAQGAVDTLKTSEATAISGVQGKSSVQQVAEQVMAAEQTLQTAIVIRDKVVAAYLELSRMQI
jgi:flagellar hook-basal body complex protein FliE